MSSESSKTQQLKSQKKATINTDKENVEKKKKNKPNNDVKIKPPSLNNNNKKTNSSSSSSSSGQKKASNLDVKSPIQPIRTITPPPRPDPTQGVRPDAKRVARQEKRNVRAELIKKLKKVSKSTEPEERNPVVKEIVEDYLKKSIKVFEARWTEGTPLTDEVFLATPLFWYKRHKWQAKDIKEFFDIAGLNRPTLDAELNLLYDLDGNAKNAKKNKKKKHLRKESMNHLAAARKDQQKRINSRSMIFTGYDKIDMAAQQLWTKFISPKYADLKQVNHDQFNILLNEWKIEVDPNVSAEIFLELITSGEEFDKTESEKTQQQQQQQQSSQNGVTGSNTLNINNDNNSNVSSPSITPTSALLANIDESLKAKQKAKIEQNSMHVSKTGNRFHSDLLSIRQQYESQQSQQSSLLPTLNENNETANENKETDEKNNNNTNGKKEEQVDENSPEFLKQRLKKISKTPIESDHFRKVMKILKQKVTREQYALNPEELTFRQRNLVILHKIFQAINHNAPLDVMNDYLASRLPIETLENPSKILELLESRKADWRQRLQVLEFLDNELETNPKLTSLFETDNCLGLIVGWTAQLLDERSNLTKSAAELFPSILSIILRNIESPAILFDDEQNLLESIFESFFVLLRSKRAKILTDIAHQAIIATVDILGTVATDLELTANHKLINILCHHTKLSVEKHEKVRAECMFYGLYLIYGIERENADTTPLISPRQPSTDNSNDKSNGNDNEEKELPDSGANDDNNNNNGDEPKITRWKLPKKAQREFLFLDTTFMETFQQMLNNGVNDKSKETRETTMKALAKIEQTYEKIFNDSFDRGVLQKYLKWKKFNGPKTDSKGKEKGSIRERQKIVKRRLSKETTDIINTDNIDNNDNIQINITTPEEQDKKDSNIIQNTNEQNNQQNSNNDSSNNNNNSNNVDNNNNNNNNNNDNNVDNNNNNNNNNNNTNSNDNNTINDITADNTNNTNNTNDASETSNNDSTQ